MSADFRDDADCGRRPTGRAERLPRQHTARLRQHGESRGIDAVVAGGRVMWAAAAPHGLLLAEGRAFGTGHAFDDHLRLPFTRPSAELRTAVGTLARVSAELRSAGGRRPPVRPLTVV